MDLSRGLGDVYKRQAVSRAMGGSCSMPLAAHATLAGPVLTLRAAWGDPDGAPTLVTAHVEGAVASLQDAEALGLQVAEALKRGGAH
jgi:hydroxymethylbilane synthase